MKKFRKFYLLWMVFVLACGSPGCATTKQNAVSSKEENVSEGKLSDGTKGKWWEYVTNPLMVITLAGSFFVIEATTHHDDCEP